jgi:hypothetical protein
MRVYQFEYKEMRQSGKRGVLIFVRNGRFYNVKLTAYSYLLI